MLNERRLSEYEVVWSNRLARATDPAPQRQSGVAR